jgi:hypothetical protein
LTINCVFAGLERVGPHHKARTTFKQSPLMLGDVRQRENFGLTPIISP